MKKILTLSIILLIISCEKKETAVLKSNVKLSDSTQIKSANQKPEIKVIPIKKQEMKMVDCKDSGGDMENGFITECLYKNYDLAEAYNDFRKRNDDNDDGKYLEKTMPSGKYKAGFSDYPLSVAYNYREKSTMRIEILFPGGVTIINFKKVKNDVMVTINHSPD